MTKGEAGEWLMHNRYFSEDWCRRTGVDPNDLTIDDVKAIKDEMDNDMYRCKRCGETKHRREFNSFDATRTSVRCKPCQKRVEPNTKIFKDGKLNTRQVKGFNWLLGYSLLDKRYV